MNPYSINPVALARKNQEPDALDKVPSLQEDEKTIKDALLAKAKQEGNPELLKEISWSETDVLQSFMPFANNPDPVVRAKSLKIYREMMQDDQIKVCVDVRIQARLSTPWEVVPGIPGDAKSEEMAGFIKENLQRMDGNFETDMEQMYSAITYGFSLSEKVFEYIDRGKYKGKIGLKKIKTREPYNYDFKIDSHGNLLGLIYVGMTGKETASGDMRGGGYGFNSLSNLTSTSPANLTGTPPLGTIANPFPPDKFIIYSYNPQFGNWYGRSDLLAAFKWWLMKKHGSKFWAIWLERYASPFIWAQYKRDAGLKPAALTAIDDFIRNLSSRQGVRVSDAIELKDIQFSATNGDAYEKAIEAYNRYMAHAILFPNLLGFTGGQGSSGGSYSLGQKQFDSFLWILNKMGRDMSETIVGEQIIKQLIQINYGDDVDLEAIPKFRFISIDDAAIEVRSKIIDSLSRGGVINKEEEWVRDFLTIPKKAPGVILPDAQQIGGFGNSGNDPNSPDNKKNPPDNGSGKPVDKKPSDEPAKKPADESQPKKEDKAMAEFKEREPDYFEKKMKVKQFKEDLERLDAGLFEEATEVIAEIRDELIDRVTRKNIVSEGDVMAVSKLTINVKDLKDTFSKWIVKIFFDSKLSQLEELERAGLNVEIVKKFAALSQNWEPLPPQEAIDYFRRKVTAKLIDDAGKKVLIDFATGVDMTFFQQRAFTIAGIVRDDIMNDAKQILLNGIKRQDQAGAVKDLKDMFNKYLEQGMEVDEELLTPNRLNTIVRTNVTEAVNEGRASMMTDPDVVNFVQFFQYTAIMDERTTDYCACMDGKVFRIEDIDILKPPAHYNCRSFTVPVTQFEIEDLKAQGRGVEVANPCEDRMAGFSDMKREPLALPIPARVADQLSQDAPAAKKSVADESADQRLKKELTQIIARCPYKACGSDKVKMIGHKFNMGEFTCEACSLPFRVSNTGDLYLYDAGMEKWERTSQGLFPSYFCEVFKGM